MRVSWVLGLLAMAALAGCAESAAPEPDSGAFDDLDVEVDEDTGVILGVVVDQAIVPVGGVKIQVTATDVALETMTDEAGRFVFKDLEPGTYFVAASKAVYESIQTTTIVEAGKESPPVLKLQLTRLFDQDPYMETLQFVGFVGCAYNFFVSSTCVNDYTRIVPVCGGGCAPQVTGIVDQREYRSEVSSGWQSVLWEMTWDNSVSGTADEMQITVSYEDRVGASHWFSSVAMGQPYRMQVDVGVPGPGAQIPSGEPEMIDPAGRDDLWNMISAGQSNVAIQQEVEIFQSNFYFAPVPDGWSLLAGDGNPF